MKVFNQFVRFLRYFKRFYITNKPLTPKISETRDITTPQTREIKTRFLDSKNPKDNSSILPLPNPKLIIAQSSSETKIESALATAEPDSVKCTYCSGSEVVKRGLRKKKLETVQLYFCHHCKKAFVWQRVKGRKFPLRIILEGLSLYNLGWSLEESCQRLKEQFGLEVKPSTLSDWAKEFEPLCRYSRLRPYGLKLFSPNQIIQTVHLYHHQVYDFSVHRGKLALLLQEYKYGQFDNLREFLEAIQSECPHQFFKEGERASELKVDFSLEGVIIREKQNFATRLAELVLQAVSDNKLRHKTLQNFMQVNDSVTVAVEVPVYMDNMDVEHMQDELNFKIPLKLDKVLTGHIDILQLRNGAVHILDYKPNAAAGKKSAAITQLTLYALMLSRLTGLRLYDFKCAWFDEKAYFEFFPLHMVYKLRQRAKKEHPDQIKLFEEEGEDVIQTNL
jgi:transposase-like protein